MSSTLADYAAQGLSDGRHLPVDNPSARSIVRNLCGENAAAAYQEAFDRGRAEKREAFAGTGRLNAYTNSNDWAEVANRTTFAVTEIAHPALRDVRENCPECLALATKAASIARVTGSVASTHSDGTHSATVVRQLGTVVL